MQTGRIRKIAVQPDSNNTDELSAIKRQEEHWNCRVSRKGQIEQNFFPEYWDNLVRYKYTQNSEMRFQKIYFIFTPPAGISGILVQMESAPEFYFQTQTLSGNLSLPPECKE